jgi:hypothetical protein
VQEINMDKKYIFWIVAVVLITTSYLLRYEIVPVSNYAYILDRWTGEIRLLAGKRYVDVKEGNQD